MTPIANDSHDRYPTTGPEEATYERYRFVTAGDDEAIIYDGTTTNAWIQSDSAVNLEDWR